MLKVGLTGGYASGKSFVAAELARLGCFVIYADQLGHAVLEPSGEAYRPAVEAFGKEILDAEGRIDRRKLAAVVFDQPELLRLLNSFVHPAVFRLEEKLMAEFQARAPEGIVVLEAAILIETARHLFFDRLIVTVCDLETQISRGMRRDHLTREQAFARIQNQMPLEEKKAYAHYIIDTSGPHENTALLVLRVFEDLSALARRHAGGNQA